MCPFYCRFSSRHAPLCFLQEAYFRYMAENPTAGLMPEEEEENVEYDSDGNPIAPVAKKIILPLPPIDHSEVSQRNPSDITAQMFISGYKRDSVALQYLVATLYIFVASCLS